jgi:hypothetical protein
VTAFLHLHTRSKYLSLRTSTCWKPILYWHSNCLKTFMRKCWCLVNILKIIICICGTRLYGPIEIIFWVPILYTSLKL